MIFLIVLLLITPTWLQAQDEQPIYLFSDDGIVILGASRQAEEIATLEMETLGITEIINPENRFVAAGHMTYDQHTLYYLQHEGILSLAYPFPVRTYVAALSTDTGASRIVFERANILNFTLSPDNRYLAVNYYEGDYYFSPVRLCVYDLQLSSNCWELPYPVGDQPGRWVNDHEFLFMKDGHLQWVNAVTRSERQIVRPEPDVWSLQGFIPVENTRMVVLLAGRRDISQRPLYQLFVMDLDSQAVLQTLEGDQSYMLLQDVSPDGRYMYYQNLTSFSVMDMTTGEVIRRFERIVHAQWVSISELAIQGHIDAESPFQIAVFDASTGAITVLASGNNAIGMMRVPPDR
jgi:hypothetical protein